MQWLEADLAGFRSDWRLAGRAQTTIEEYERQVRRYAAWSGVESVSLPLVRSWLAEEAERTRSGAKMSYRALRAFSKWLASEYDEADVLARLVAPREPTPTRTKVASTEDVERLLAACSGPHWIDRRDHALVSVLACTGLRRAEVVRMRLDHLDLATGALTVPLTKTQRVRVVRLDSKAVRSLRRYLRAVTIDDVIWVGRRHQPLGESGIRLAIERHTKEAGVDVTPHAFRRGFAVEWLRRGGSETYLRRVAGWDSPSMVGRYVAVVAQEEALREHQRLFG